MRRNRLIALVALIPLCAGGCAETTFNGKSDADGSVPTDSRSGDLSPVPDVLPPPPTSPRQLSVVVNKLILPKSEKDFAIDLDNAALGGGRDASSQQFAVDLK